MTNETLVGLLKHPVVKMHLKPEILIGLSGKAQVDYAIGVVKEAIDTCPFNLSLGKGYKKLKEEYPLYFRGASPIDETEIKKPVYKAGNGF